MTFDEAILNTTKGVDNIKGDPIRNKILYSRWEKRYCKTIKEFYELFIEPRLPSIDICLKWNNLLEWYLSEPNAIFFYRGGNVPKKCRRGWMCEQGNSSNDEVIRFIYDDNDLACFIYKMALDEFCPTNHEFFEFMTHFKNANQIDWIPKSKSLPITNRKYLSFPGKFTPNENYETDNNVLFLYDVSPTCCLGQYNYKHAHIFDVKGKYTINCRIIDGRAKENKDNVLSVFDIDENDRCKYVYDHSLGVSVYKKDKVDLHLFNELKQFLKAETMRFLNPLNHFLAPMDKCNKFTKRDGTIDLDIAEYDNLQKYIIYRKRQLFSMNGANIYQKYEKYVLPSDDFISFTNEEAEKMGEENIDVIFHEKSISDGKLYKGYKEKNGYDIVVSKILIKQQRIQSGTVRIGKKIVNYKGNNYSYREYVLFAIKDYILKCNVQSLSDLLKEFPKIAILSSAVPTKDNNRWHKEEIDLPSGEHIRITNQISHGAGRKEWDIKYLQPKLEKLGIK